MAAAAKRHRSVDEQSSRMTTLRHSLARLTPSGVQCRLGCSGAACRFCRADAWDTADQAILGVYSHWITNDMLAMARPTTDAIDKFDIVGQFVK